MILLASDGSRESLIALREGALIAAAQHARAFLLIVEPQTAGTATADGINVRGADPEANEMLTRGLERLGRLGVAASGRVVAGDPAREIARAAIEAQADLIVVGHRRRAFMERWWSGASGAYIIDHVNCSVLVARNVVSDEAFEAAIGEAETVTA